MTSGFLVGESLELLLNPAGALPGGHVAPAPSSLLWEELALGNFVLA